METLRMKTRTNRRRCEENFVEGRHLKLKDLRVTDKGLQNQYLSKTYILSYPRPEFHVSRLKHDTDQEGLKGIRKEGGFMNPNDGSLVWFSLVVGPEEIEAAERRLLETTYPDRTKVQIQNQQSFLEKFATSPAFQRSLKYGPRRSRYGPYRFTFSVEEVLEAYKDQFCSGAEPVMRVMETVLYKQEVVYVVLVHSPADEERFSKYPLLDENPDPVCVYEEGRFMWRSEAMCETHWFRLVQNKAEKMMGAVKVEEWDKEFYVWDHVTIALHVGKQVLKFDKLREKLTFCYKGNVSLSFFDDFSTAEGEVKGLWPDYPSPLKRDGEWTQEVPQE